MSNSSFKFKLIEHSLVETKKGKRGYIVAYCSYGFNVEFWIDLETYNTFINLVKSPSFDLTDYVYVFYDKKNGQFRYLIQIKK